MKTFPVPMLKLIDDFSKMPGIGGYSAQRLTSYILQAPKEDIESLIRHIKEVKDKIKFCQNCNNLSDGDICSICADTYRDKFTICVVDGVSGIVAMEKSGAYRGVYHVLIGDLSPIEGIGPEDLKIEKLVFRVRTDKVKEVIIATDFTTEGETTALFLEHVLRPLNIKVARLARGVPVGGSLRFADIATIQRALEERRTLS